MCFIQIVICLLTACGNPPSGARPSGRAGDSSQAIAVYSKASNGYVRARNADGSFQPESYELVAGDRGNSIESKSYDKLSLEDISLAIRKPLAIQNYVPSDDPTRTNLLILVYWGVTLDPDDLRPYGFRGSDFAAGSNDYHGLGTSVPDLPPWVPRGSPAEQAPVFQKFEAAQDAQTDSRNAAILGYTDALLGARPDDLRIWDQPGDPRFGALIAELEQHRYYVVLLAFDCRTARRYGLHKLLWETRFSLTERGNDFGKALPAMALIAAKYFGQDSHGLIHNYLKEGHVEVGEPKSIDTVP